FARATLALYQDRGGFAGGNFLHEVHQFGRLGRHRDHFVIAGVPANLTPQRLNLAPQVVSFQRILDRDVEFFEIQRLAHEIVSAQLESGLDVVQLRVGGNHDDGGGSAALFELFQDL